MKDLLKEILANCGFDTSKMSYRTKSKVFGDNQGAIVVATCPRMAPTSKLIAVKYHWFREHVGKHLILSKFQEMSKLQICLQKVYKVKGFYTSES